MCDTTKSESTSAYSLVVALAMVETGIKSGFPLRPFPKYVNSSMGRYRKRIRDEWPGKDQLKTKRAKSTYYRLRRAATWTVVRKIFEECNESSSDSPRDGYPMYAPMCFDVRSHRRRTRRGQHDGDRPASSDTPPGDDDDEGLVEEEITLVFEHAEDVILKVVEEEGDYSSWKDAATNLEGAERAQRIFAWLTETIKLFKTFIPEGDIRLAFDNLMQIRKGAIQHALEHQGPDPQADTPPP